MKETELAQKFVDYLSCYDLYFEVDYYRSVDIVAIAEKYSISVEVKTTFNFKVLEQAIENAKHFNYSYIACPTFRDWSIQGEICKNYGIGLLVYNPNQYYGNTVNEFVKPRLNRHAQILHLRARLGDIHKLSLPGSKNGDSTKITAFGITVDNAVRYISRQPGCTFKELTANISHHYSTNEAAKNNLYQWIRSGVIKNIVNCDGKLYVKGKEEPINNNIF